MNIGRLGYIGRLGKPGKSVSSSWTPLIPYDLTLSVISDTRIDLSVSYDNADYDGFSWERSDNGGVDYTEIATTLITDANAGKTYSNTGLTGATTYYYRVRSYKG